MKPEKKFAESYLRHHYEANNGKPLAAKDKSKVVTKATKAAKDSGLKWPKSKPAMADFLRQFCLGAGEAQLDSQEIEGSPDESEEKSSCDAADCECKDPSECEKELGGSAEVLGSEE